MNIRKLVIPITGSSTGGSTVYSEGFTGKVLAVAYTMGTLPNTTDIAVTLEATTEPILTENNIAASFVKYPRAGVHGVTGTALTYDGSRLVTDYIHGHMDRIKVVVTDAGAATTAGTLTVIVG